MEPELSGDTGLDNAESEYFDRQSCVDNVWSCGPLYIITLC